MFWESCPGRNPGSCTGWTSAYPSTPSPAAARPRYLMDRNVDITVMWMSFCYVITDWYALNNNKKLRLDVFPARREETQSELCVWIVRVFQVVSRTGRQRTSRPSAGAVAQRGGCSQLISIGDMKLRFHQSVFSLVPPDQLCVSTADSSFTGGQGCSQAAFALRQLETAGQAEHNSS